MDIYCICNPKMVVRKDNMERRLKNIGLLDRTIFVSGGNVGDSLCEHYCSMNEEGFGMIGCLVGHIKCLRKFVETEKTRACIIEDDVLFHNNFTTEIDNVPDATLVQLYSMSLVENTNTKQDIYGTQGYVIRRDYALFYLQNFDKPIKYWSEKRFPTSESITMYSNGLVLNANPLIIEDNISYSGNNTFTPSNDQLYRQLLPSYTKGLQHYIDCDPEFKFHSYILSDLWSTLTSTSLSSTDLSNILKRVHLSENVDDIVILSVLHMLCDYYIDKTEAQKWADLFFRTICSGKVETVLKNYFDFILNISRFYNPSFPDRYTPVNDSYWIKIHNVPIYDI